MNVRLFAVLAVLLVSCADSGTDRGSTGDLVAVPVAARTVSTADPGIAGKAVSDFGLDLFSASRSVGAGENITVSPTSVALALAMLEPGASGEAWAQFHSLLRIDDPATFHASMNALEQALESRVPQVFSPGDDPGEVVVRIANAAYLQKGYPFEPAYLETVGANYGPVLNEVDFEPDPDAIAHQINAFVAAATNDKITKLIDDGVIRPETVLALVNALYLKASWLQSFEKTLTADEAFTRLDGTDVKVPMMHGRSDSSASGDGWIGATKSYVGGLSAQFILPDEGRFDEVAADLGRVFSDYDANKTEGGDLGLPRFELRYAAELSDSLQSLGLTAPYVNGGLLGVANDPKLVIDKVIHQTYVAMNEEGTEAAAATVVLAYPTSAPVQQPIPVVLDRPFLYRIIDDQSGATLFIGQVMNPLG